MSKRTLMLVVALVAALAIATTSTLAYLTSEDGAVNVMVVGNVEIEQNEEQRPEIGSTELEDFEQFKPFLPAVYDSITWAPDTEWPAPEDVEDKTPWKVFNSNMANVQDKFVTVENTGKNDAYVRTIIAYEWPEGLDDLIHINVNNIDGVVAMDEVGFVTLADGVRYMVYAFTYDEALAPGEETIPSLKQVFMNKVADNEEMALFGDNFEVLALSQGVQAEGFADADTALDEAFYALGADASEEDEAALIDDLNQLLEEEYPWDGVTEMPTTNWQTEGNPDTSWYDASATEYTLDTAEELAGLAKLVAEGNSFSGKTVKLGADLDLGDHMWAPIGNDQKNIYFAGTFDGQDHTISNLYVDANANAGLFGSVRSGYVMNVTVENAVINCDHHAGAVVGHGVCARILNCHADGVVINAADESGEDGDKVGGVVGYNSAEPQGAVANCSAKNVEITANRDAGAIVGAAISVSGSVWNLEGNTFSDCTITYSGFGSGANIDDSDDGIGRQ